jgi:apolipoprotein N-acyltransferase
MTICVKQQEVQGCRVYTWPIRVILALSAAILFALGNWQTGFPISILGCALLCLSVWKAPAWWGSLASFAFFGSLLVIFLLPAEREEMDLWIPRYVQFVIPLVLGALYCLPFTVLAALSSTTTQPILLAFLFGAGVAGCDFLLAAFTLLGVGASPALSMDVNTLISGWGYWGGFVGITFGMFATSALVAALLQKGTTKATRGRAGIAIGGLVLAGVSGIFLVSPPQKVQSGGIVPQSKFSPDETSAEVVVLPEGCSNFKAALRTFEGKASQKEPLKVRYDGRELGVILIECPWGKRESFCLIFEKDGQLTGLYEKTYPLWRKPSGSPRYYLKETAMGKLGTAICFDSLHLPMFPGYARLGAKVMAWPCDDGSGWPARRHIRVARLWALCTGMMIVRSSSFMPGAYQGVYSLSAAGTEGFIPSPARTVPGVYILSWLGCAGVAAFFGLIFLGIRDSRGRIQ